jgi:hypothetical protein
MIKGDWFITTIKLRAITEISYGVSHKDLKLTLVCASAITTDCRELKKWGAGFQYGIMLSPYFMRFRNSQTIHTCTDSRAIPWA